MNNLKQILIIGDKVLVKPKTLDPQTKSGLYLPAGVKAKEKVQTGYIMRVGPGYPIPPSYDFEEEPWKEQKEVDYLPLQAGEGDLALYLQKDAVEINYEGEKYFIVPHNAILMLVREEEDLI